VKHIQVQQTGMPCFLLNTKLGTGMILLKNKVNVFLRFFETLPPSCNEDVNFSYTFNGPHDPCEMTHYTNKH